MDTKELEDLSPTNFKDEYNINIAKGEAPSAVSGGITKSAAKLVGDEGERIACEYLVENGYKILGKNYRIKFGEIDIIARKKWKLFSRAEKTIHFIEVKTAMGDGNFFPEEKVNYKKQKKLIGLCQIWLEKNKLPQSYPYQIDVIGVILNQNGKNNKIHYFQNVVEDQ